jgi:hypothetical protein
MAPERRERYQSVRALSADVSCFLEGLPVAAYPEGILERVRRLATKYRVPLLLILGYLLMRIALLLFAGG